MGASPYIVSMRRKVGHDLLLLPSVAVLPMDPDGRFLLVRQTDFDRWATIGGLIEVDEAPEQAAKREALEEAGVEIEIVELLVALGGPDHRISYTNGDEVAYVSMVYLAKVVGGEARHDGDETSEVGWFSPSEMRDLEMGEFNRRLLRDVLPLLEGRST